MDATAHTAAASPAALAEQSAAYHGDERNKLDASLEEQHRRATAELEALEAERQAATDAWHRAEVDVRARLEALSAAGTTLAAAERILASPPSAPTPGPVASPSPLRGTVVAGGHVAQSIPAARQ